MHVGDLRGIVLSRYIIGNVFHWPRTIKRHHSNDIFKTVWLQTTEHIAHACRFQLEHANCVTNRQHFKSFGIIKRYRVKINVNAALGNEFNRSLKHSECFQPQKVKFDKPRLFNPFHVELRYWHVRTRITI